MGRLRSLGFQSKLLIMLLTVSVVEASVLNVPPAEPRVIPRLALMDMLAVVFSVPLFAPPPMVNRFATTEPGVMPRLFSLEI